MEFFSRRLDHKTPLQDRPAGPGDFPRRTAGDVLGPAHRRPPVGVRQRRLRLRPPLPRHVRALHPRRPAAGRPGAHLPVGRPAPGGGAERMGGRAGGAVLLSDWGVRSGGRLRVGRVRGDGVEFASAGPQERGGAGERVDGGVRYLVMPGDGGWICGMFLFADVRVYFSTVFCTWEF